MYETQVKMVHVIVERDEDKTAEVEDRREGSRGEEEG